MADEYFTTTAVSTAEHPSRPVVPPGERWVMCGSDVLMLPHGERWVMCGSDVLMLPHAVCFFWYWHRAEQKVTPCPRPNCGALARKNGKCIGCGEAVDG